MKKRLILFGISAAGILAASLFSGCAVMRVSQEVNNGGTNTSFRAATFLSNTAWKNLGVNKTTKTTSSLLGASSATSEPNPDAITASGAALGELIGTAAKAAAGK